MRFTRSTDGTPRADIRVTLRLSAGEIGVQRIMAAEAGVSWRTWLREMAESGVYSAVVNYYDELRNGLIPDESDRLN
jgi:hypothetical protein